jgi:hypothetical protein
MTLILVARTKSRLSEHETGKKKLRIQDAYSFHFGAEAAGCLSWNARIDLIGHQPSTLTAITHTKIDTVTPFFAVTQDFCFAAV